MAERYFEDMRSKVSGMGKRDPAFTEEAYEKWLERFGRVDTPRNRIHFFIWFHKKGTNQRKETV
jgi:hypothetical protein